MQENIRDQRTADFVRDTLARIIQVQLRDPRVGLVSINEVRISKDRTAADVYFSSMEVEALSPGAAKGAPQEESAFVQLAERKAVLVSILNGAAGFLRSQMAKQVRLRMTPKPRFHYDESLARGRCLERLIDRATAVEPGSR